MSEWSDTDEGGLCWTFRLRRAIMIVMGFGSFAWNLIVQWFLPYQGAVIIGCGWQDGREGFSNLPFCCLGPVRLRGGSEEGVENERDGVVKIVVLVVLSQNEGTFLGWSFSDVGGVLTEARSTILNDKIIFVWIRDFYIKPCILNHIYEFPKQIVKWSS